MYIVTFITVKYEKSINSLNEVENPKSLFSDYFFPSLDFSKYFNGKLIHIIITKFIIYTGLTFT